jgi:hypothetical protein
VGASYQKPTDQKINRNPTKLSWVSLPPGGRIAAPPELPDNLLKQGTVWMPATLEAWSRMWASPQALMWDQTGQSLHAWAILHDALIRGDKAPAPLIGEMRQIEDRHGLNPKAMAQLCWRIGDEDDEAEQAEPEAPKKRLRVVGD